MGLQVVGDLGSLTLLGPTIKTHPGLPAGIVSSVVFAPVKTEIQRHPWKTGIVATVFWVGEPAGENNPVHNRSSSWDRSWINSFGGVDDPNPDNRAGDFRPAGFVPRQNPFYVALPYNDCLDTNVTKTEAANIIPWFQKAFIGHGKSVCKNRWIAIRHGDRVCYAQWSDCGPYRTDDAAYVFGNARPANTKHNGAALDLAPAVRDYLDFKSGKTCDWRFVELDEVPEGPWKIYGSNNHFASEALKTMPPVSPMVFIPTPGGDRSGTTPPSKADTSRCVATAASTKLLQLTGKARIEELKRQRDLWLRR